MTFTLHEAENSMVGVYPSPAEDRALELPTVPATGDVPAETIMARAVDNGSYFVWFYHDTTSVIGQSDVYGIGRDGRSNGEVVDHAPIYKPILVYACSQAFNPLSPIFAPARFYGEIPNDNSFGTNMARFGQGLLMAVKATATLLGAAATATTVLTTIAALGGPLGALAGALLPVVSSLSIAGGVVTAGAAVATGSIGGLISGVAGAIAASGPAAAFVAVAMAIVIAFVALASAFGAHATIVSNYLGHQDQIRVCYRDGDKLLGYNFFNTGTILDPKDLTSQKAALRPPAPLGVGVWGQVNGELGAELSDIDAETFFAGLVYLQTSLDHVLVDGGQHDINGYRSGLDLLWTRRVSSKGIAAFRAARASGSRVSDAIAKALPFVELTPSQAVMKKDPLDIAAQGALSAAFPGNKEALGLLGEAHRVNEENALAAMATSDFKASPLASAASVFGESAGLPIVSNAGRGGNQGLGGSTRVRFAMPSYQIRKLVSGPGGAASHVLFTPRSLTTKAKDDSSSLLPLALGAGLALFFLTRKR